jgi:hypothetical protein
MYKIVNMMYRNALRNDTRGCEDAQKSLIPEWSKATKSTDHIEVALKNNLELLDISNSLDDQFNPFHLSHFSPLFSSCRRLRDQLPPFYGQHGHRGCKAVPQARYNMRYGAKKEPQC